MGRGTDGSDGSEPGSSVAIGTAVHAAFRRQIEESDRMMREAMRQADMGSPIGGVFTMTLDGSGPFVVGPPAEPPKPRTTGVSWDDIVGLEDAKEALREALVYPHTHAELYATYGFKPPRGVLLYGPPGCGKTLLGKAAATAMGADLDRPDGGYQYVKGPALSDKYIGECARKIRSLFAKAKTYAQRTKKPGVIFLDEADSILGARGQAWTDPESVPTFLSEMDGLDGASNAFVILGTNRQGVLDPAITRDGRVDRRIEVPRPGREGVASIVRAAIGKAPLHNCSPEEAAEHVASLVFGSELVVRELGTIEGKVIAIHLHHCISGAASVGIVHRAISYALARDRKANEKVIASGVRLSDFERACAASAAEMKGTNLNEIAFDVAAEAVGEELARQHIVRPRGDGVSLEGGKAAQERKLN